MTDLPNLLPHRRVKFTVEIEVDLDRVPGWGYQVQDFHDHVVKSLEENSSHYNMKVKVL